jgi:DNA polymerase-3 subunit epsilon
MIAVIDFETTGLKPGTDEVLQVSIIDGYTAAVQDILNKADTVIAYNSAFEDGFLREYGIEVDNKKWFDPMPVFAKIYGERSEKHGGYKWQSLIKCARYYGYEFKAHDSLEDVKATLYCYKRMTSGKEGERCKC